MLKEIIGKLKHRKAYLENISGTHVEENKSAFEIILEKDNNFLKMTIDDYILLTDYDERMKLIDNLGIEALVCTAVLWNNARQKVNKGTYYVTSVDNAIYNILVGDEGLRLDERIVNEDITEEKVLIIKNDDFSYTVHKHDATGNTFYTKYYNNKGFDFGNLLLSKEEYLGSVKNFINNIEHIDGIERIIDVKKIKNSILFDLEIDDKPKKFL